MGDYAKRPVADGFSRHMETSWGMEYEELCYGDRWEGKMEVNVGAGRKVKRSGGAQGGCLEL